MSAEVNPDVLPSYVPVKDVDRMEVGEGGGKLGKKGSALALGKTGATAGLTTEEKEFELRTAMARVPTIFLEIKIKYAKIET